MKDAILISIKPEWCEKILNGEKTKEARKKKPSCKLPVDVYIYCTKGKYETFTPPLSDTNYEHSFGYVMNGKIIAKFTLKKIDEFYVFKDGNIQYWSACDLEKTCVSYDELSKYIGKGKKGYAWNIENLEIFNVPKELSDFKSSYFHCFNMGNVECKENVFGDVVFKHYNNSFCRICKYFDDFGDCSKIGNKTLIKAPQSWCYIEVD